MSVIRWPEAFNEHCRLENTKALQELEVGK